MQQGRLTYATASVDTNRICQSDRRSLSAARREQRGRKSEIDGPSGARYPRVVCLALDLTLLPLCRQAGVLYRAQGPEETWSGLLVCLPKAPEQAPRRLSWDDRPTHPC